MFYPLPDDKLLGSLSSERAEDAGNMIRAVAAPLCKVLNFWNFFRVGANFSKGAI